MPVTDNDQGNRRADHGDGPGNMSLNPPTEHQRKALNACTAWNVGLLTGTAGSGKTTAIAHYLLEVLSRPGNRGVKAAALSAAAARRLTNKLHDAGIQVEATTIHRMLEYQYHEGHGVFGRNRSNPIDAGVIVIDEASMPPVTLLSHVLAARRPNSQIIFVGDTNQVSPIGNGAPFRDMLQMGLPHGHLTEIHRNAGRVVKCCKLIAEEQRFEASREIDVAPIGDDHDDENLFVDDRWNKADEQTKVIEDWLNPTSDMFEIDGISDPIWDVQVIAPLKKKGSPLGCHSLNPKIQSWLNGGGETVKGNSFRVGDKAMCVDNDWYSAAPGCPRDVQNEDGKVFVANGNLGRVIDLDARWTIAEFDLPKRIVRFGKAKRKTATEGDDSTGKLELGYCATIHKFQGSQSPGIIFVGDESPGSKFCDRHVVLTAISRMERLCVCVAKPARLKEWCKKSKLGKIRTFAVEKFHELMRAA